MATHHDQLAAAAVEHGWTVLESNPTQMELRRDGINLTFGFRSDGQLASGSREDRSAPPGTRFTAHILKNTTGRLTTAKSWIAEATEASTTEDLDRATK